MLAARLGTGARADGVDALRGLAMVWMTVFHFCFDLSHFRYWPQDFLHDPFWTLQRTAIVSLFLFCAGLGQALALEQAQAGGALAGAGCRLRPARCWCRWGPGSCFRAATSISGCCTAWR